MSHIMLLEIYSTKTSYHLFSPHIKKTNKNVNKAYQHDNLVFKVFYYTRPCSINQGI